MIKITQTQIAKYLGVDTGRMSKIRKGTLNLPLQTALNLSKKSELTMDFIVRIHGEKLYQAVCSEYEKDIARKLFKKCFN
jgi:plasmid maintenance system antidote protein VapI